MMNIISYLIGAVIVAGFYFLLKHKKKKQYAKLSGGFSRHVGTQLKESELLCILVLEELERYREEKTIPILQQCRKKHIIFTGVYIAVNFVLLMSDYYKPETVIWCVVFALLYTYLCHRVDTVWEICKAVKEQPNREISRIVREMITDQPKKSLKWVALVSIVLSWVLVFAMNANERYVFAPTDGGYSVEKYRPAIIDSSMFLKIPETYNDQPVVAIGKHAFEDLDIYRVTIPDTVVLIDSYAFRDCERLSNVVLPEGLQVLNGESFKNCRSLTEIVIPEGVKEIRGNTFEGCTALKNVELHDGIIDIHAYAFMGCSALRQITLPSAITEIHAYTFENCVSLQEIEIPMGVTRIAAHAFYNCRRLGYVFVPDSVTEIGSSAFRECAKLKEIELPDGVSVNEKAFEDSPTVIKKKAFTDEQLLQIIAAAEEKIVPTLYYVYEKDNPEQVVQWEHVTILLVDDIRFAEKLDETKALQAVNSHTELLQYLESAKVAGCTQILRGIYSPMASEIIGEDYFVSATGTIEDQIAECLIGIAEEENA